MWDARGMRGGMRGGMCGDAEGDALRDACESGSKGAVFTVRSQ